MEHHRIFVIMHRKDAKDFQQAMTIRAGSVGGDSPAEPSETTPRRSLVSEVPKGGRTSVDHL